MTGEANLRRSRQENRKGDTSVGLFSSSSFSSWRWEDAGKPPEQRGKEERRLSLSPAEMSRGEGQVEALEPPQDISVLYYMKKSVKICASFTSRIKHIQDEEVDFTDRLYQDKLPMVARSTASRAIKSNIKLTEIMVEPNENKNKQKVNAIINMHMQRRLLEREQDPARFGIKPTLGERAIRRPSVVAPCLSMTNIHKEKPVLAPSASTEIRGKVGVHFKAIQVKQAERHPFEAHINADSTSTHFKGL
ncbi:hypothetical protein JD844_026973 [Phrynosoma platyrhinos]|uniref:Uncharacterized protein n=1 Tax=Phrynosoma platyrhinos TaxID=52577 RepID=A0ABQ7SFI1_PHRPL|nr:hypothetical protein JD844_026973 [Phrynosoma platyrhinos]